MATPTSTKLPWGIRWRAGESFILTTVAIGLFTDLFLYGLIVPIMPFILRDRLGMRGSALQAWTSTLLALFAGATCFFSPLAGYVCDLLSQRKLLFVVGLACLLASIVITAFGQTLLLLILGRVLGGASGAIVWVVGIALVMDTVGPDRMGAAMGVIFSVISVAELIAPVLGGVIYQKLGSTATFGLGFVLVALDIVMRLLVIEKRTALHYGVVEDAPATANREESGDEDEMTSLLSKADHGDQFKIHGEPSGIVKFFPVLYCFRHHRFLSCYVMYILIAMLFGLYDSTVPTQAIDLFNVDPLKAGIMFVPIVIPAMIFSPIAGRLVDKHGAKPCAVIGIAITAIPLACMRIPHAGGINELLKMVTILIFAGCGNALYGSVPIVDITKIVARYHKANPDFFGEMGPYGQTYALSSMTFNLGLTLGPILGGLLKETIGFGNTYLLAAITCALCAVMAYYYVGDPSEWPLRRKV